MPTTCKFVYIRSFSINHKKNKRKMEEESMSYVINDVVKMEWEEKRFLQAKGSGKKKVFIMAGKDYQTSAGEVPVFFDTEQAWVIEDDAGLFSFADVKDYLANNSDPGFPESLEEYIQIADVQGNTYNDEVIKRLGLDEYIEDIKKRIRDVAPYAEEKEIKVE